MMLEQPTKPGPLISVVVTNYNYAQFVCDAVNSALQFDPSIVQTIIVDDGSTDNSREILAQFGDRAELIFKPNGGHGSAFNVGVQASQGDWVVILDADDILSPELVDIVRNHAAPEVSKITWTLPIINPSGNRTGASLPAPDDDSKPLLALLRQNGPHAFTYSPTSGNAWSRRFLDQVLPLPEQEFWRGADSYLLHTSPIYGRTAVASQAGSMYRRHGKNFLAAKNEFQIRDLLRERFDRTATAIRKHLEMNGLSANWTNWRYEHGERLDELEEAIERHIPLDAEVVLIDGDAMNVQRDLLGRLRHYLMANSAGNFDGPPEHGDQAVEQLREYNTRGVRHVVVVWYCFWWLEHYASLAQELRRAYKQTHSSKSVVIFEMVDA